MTTSRTTDANGVQIFRRFGYETRSSRRMRVVEISTRFLMLTVMPVVLVVTVRMLLGQSVAGIGLGGGILALGLSIALTIYRLFSTPARVLVAQDAVAVDDAWSVRSTGSVQQRQWNRVLDCRGNSESFDATIGLGTYRFVRQDWDDFDRLHELLRRLAVRREDGPS